MNYKTMARYACALLTLAIILSFGTTLPVMASSGQQAELNTTFEVISNIATDTLWTAENVYYIKNDISVNPGVTLTIQGGTIIKFWVPLDPSIVGADLTSLTVNGSLAFVPGPD
ncbi:hypothetical protein EG834_22120, partial [bacterium]|nr:hypothetical protein [bacterium]